MNGHEKINLNAGDEIGFVQLAQDIDSPDSIFFCKVVEVVRHENQRAYRYQYPDGEISRRIVTQSDLASYLIRVHRKQSESVTPLYVEVTDAAIGAAIERANNQSYVAFITSRNLERDSFEVYSSTSGNTYRVEIREEARGKRILGRCNCPDFTQRNRVCKHLSIVASSRNSIGLATRTELATAA